MTPSPASTPRDAPNFPLITAAVAVVAFVFLSVSVALYPRFGALGFLIVGIPIAQFIALVGFIYARVVGKHELLAGAAVFAFTAPTGFLVIRLLSN